MAESQPYITVTHLSKLVETTGTKTWGPTTKSYIAVNIIVILLIIKIMSV